MFKRLLAIVALTLATTLCQAHGSSHPVYTPVNISPTQQTCMRMIGLSSLNMSSVETMYVWSASGTAPTDSGYTCLQASCPANHFYLVLRTSSRNFYVYPTVDAQAAYALMSKLTAKPCGE